MHNRFKDALRNVNVLVIDENDLVSMLIAEVLADCGATVTTTAGGPTAMELLRDQRIDLVLLDRYAQAGDGGSFLRTLRRTRPDLLNRTVLMTPNQAALVNDVLAGDLPILAKPFNIDELRSLACQTYFLSQSAVRLSAA